MQATQSKQPECCTHQLSALATVCLNAPILESAQADFRRNTWTFQAGGHAVSAGRFALVREDLLQRALAADAEKKSATLAFAPITSPTQVRFTTIGGDRAVEVKRAGLEVTLYNDRLPDPEKPWREHRPACWYGSIERVDEEGNTWRRSTGHLVMDDFGTLVPVESA